MDHVALPIFCSLLKREAAVAVRQVEASSAGDQYLQSVQKPFAGRVVDGQRARGRVRQVGIRSSLQQQLGHFGVAQFHHLEGGKEDRGVVSRPLHPWLGLVLGSRFQA